MRFTTLSVLLLSTLALATPDSDPAIEKRDDNTDSDLSNPLSNLYTYLSTYLHIPYSQPHLHLANKPSNQQSQPNYNHHNAHALPRSTYLHPIRPHH